MKTSQEEWDNRFMELAKTIASWSKDPNKQVGAVLVSPDRREFAVGYNGLPRDTELQEDQEKNDYTVHAELNALFNAKQDVQGWTLYATLAPCLHCAIAIKQKQIARIVTYAPWALSSWCDVQKKAEQFLITSGVKLEWL